MKQPFFTKDDSIEIDLGPLSADVVDIDTANEKVQPVLDRVEGLEHDCRHLKGSWLECLKRLKAAEEVLKEALPFIITYDTNLRPIPSAIRLEKKARAYFASYGEQGDKP